MSGTPDIFDEVAAKPKGDIFDQAGDQWGQYLSKKGDEFEQYATPRTSGTYTEGDVDKPQGSYTDADVDDSSTRI